MTIRQNQGGIRTKKEELTKKEKIVENTKKRFPAIDIESQHELLIMEITIEETIKEIRPDIIEWAIGCFGSDFKIHATERLEKMLKEYYEIPEIKNCIYCGKKLNEFEQKKYSNCCDKCGKNRDFEGG